MGYLNNTTRVLDAILTKKGREILSSGGSGGLGSFEVTKFALGDDEIDYGLWDTTHTQGSTHYGAILDNLPALEPFNDPSEIMKYKLVTRSKDTEAMAKLRDRHQESEPYWQATLAKTAANDDSTGLNWFATKQAGFDSNRVRIRPYDENSEQGTEAAVGRGKQFGILHLDNRDYGAVDFQDYQDEGYTITVLDSTVAFLAPAEQDSGGGSDGNVYRYYIQSQNQANQLLWEPFVTSVQHVSQTIRNCQVVEGEFHKHSYNSNTGEWSLGQWRAGENQNGVAIYPKRIASNNSPAKTSILITGETSGATFEYDVTVTYDSGTGTD